MAINIGGKDFSEAELAALAKAGVLSVGAKNDPASTTATGNPLHGTNQAGLGNVYGAIPSNLDLVTRFYHNVLGRPGEQAGISFLLGELSIS